MSKITKKVFKEWLIGRYLESVLGSHLFKFDEETAKKANLFSSDVMSFLEEHELLK